jgi:hypothetical protein
LLAWCRLEAPSYSFLTATTAQGLLELQCDKSNTFRKQQQQPALRIAIEIGEGGELQSVSQQYRLKCEDAFTWEPGALTYNKAVFVPQAVQVVFMRGNQDATPSGYTLEIRSRLSAINTTDSLYSEAIALEVGPFYRQI